MTYLNYDVFDKALVIDPLFKKLEKRLAYAGSKWNPSQVFKVKCYAQDARDYFKDLLLQSLSTAQEYRVDSTCYPHITQIYPSFTHDLGDPFLDICLLPSPDDEPDLDEPNHPTKGGGFSVFDSDREQPSAILGPSGELDSVEKLTCLILFAEHMIAFCDSLWDEVDASDLDYLALVNGLLDDEAAHGGAIDTYDTGVREIEPLFENKLRLKPVTGATAEKGGVYVDVNDLLEMIGMA